MGLIIPKFDLEANPQLKNGNLGKEIALKIPSYEYNIDYILNNIKYYFPEIEKLYLCIAHYYDLHKDNYYQILHIENNKTYQKMEKEGIKIVTVPIIEESHMFYNFCLGLTSQMWEMVIIGRHDLSRQINRAEISKRIDDLTNKNHRSTKKIIIGGFTEDLLTERYNGRDISTRSALVFCYNHKDDYEKISRMNYENEEGCK